MQQQNYGDYIAGKSLWDALDHQSTFWQWFKDSNMQSSKTQIILRDRYTAPAAKQVTVENGR
jgi:hypothetical protein